MALNHSIQIEGLTKIFGHQKAVDEISFSVNEGEILGLVGPNGAGKTTTIRMLTTILPPTNGTAKIYGYNIQSHANQVRNIIGYVPQAISADGDLTGYENLLIFSKLLGIPKPLRKEKIYEILKTMGLTDAADRRVRNYSGGMVRRLEIGQAMLIQPRILFLDEPTIGLDPVARETVWELLESFRQQNLLTIFITTHYMEEAEALCDRLAIMNNGKIVAIGTPEELKTSTNSPDATLEDAFRFFTGGDYAGEGNFRELRRTRRLARRLS